jgi:alpha-1,2-mannosyltransferase
MDSGSHSRVIALAPAPRARLVAYLRLAGNVFLLMVPLILLPASLLLVGLAPVRDGWPHGLDFHTLWTAGSRYMHGQSPYVSSLRDFVGDGPLQSYVYPPVAAALVTPLAALPYGVALACFEALSLLALAAGLWLLGVRDWRCYGAVALAPAAFTALAVGTLTPVLFLAVAAAWRLRRTRWCGLIVGITIALKLFLWPLLLWLYVTRRRGQAALGVAAAAALAAATWMPIRFADLTSYPALVNRLSQVEAPRSLSIVSLASAHTHVALALLSLLSVVAVGATVLLSGRISRRAGDELVFAAAIVAALLLSPILWLHYLTLLFAAVAIFRPRLSVAWLVPTAAWLSSQQGSVEGGYRQSVLSLSIAALTLAVVAAPWIMSRRHARVLDHR